MYDEHPFAREGGAPRAGVVVGLQGAQLGKAGRAMVLGIIGLCTGWCWGVGAVLGIVGIVLAIMSGNKSKQVGLKQNGLAITGLVCSIIAVVCGAGCLICTISAFSAVNSAPYVSYNYKW